MGKWFLFRFSIMQNMNLVILNYNIFIYSELMGLWQITFCLHICGQIKTYHLPRGLWQLNHASTFLQEFISIEIHDSSIRREGHLSEINLAI